MELSKALQISAAGMKAQGTRLRVIAENMANADSLPETPNDLPYRRKVVLFRNEMDRALGVERVTVSKIDVDGGEFDREYMPGHPAADGEGYVLKPNVSTLIEMTDMREAQRSYEANIGVVELSRTMLMRTIDLLRN
ncbi:MAG TPA: flagellar basal body rod protein FlgC [Alphaproteobacteria bacterium]|nr:flagellar basal body rod protein FlgC [Alphaproteobacteria bacterium]